MKTNEKNNVKNVKYLIMSGVLLLFLIVLTVLVKMNYMVGFDTFIYNNVAKLINPTNTVIFKCITFLGSTEFIILLILALLLFWRKGRRGIQVTAFMIFSVLVNQVMKVFIRRPRPVDVEHLVTETSFSFPSGHTMASATIVGFLIYVIWKGNLKKNIKIILTVILSIFLLLVMFSRVYLGAHFATDVIGGLITSAILTFIVIYFIEF
ncbi:MAG: phosphatase PAP2 family protein [Bacilli bacterium]